MKAQLVFLLEEQRAHMGEAIWLVVSRHPREADARRAMFERIQGRRAKAADLRVRLEGISADG